MILTKLLKYIIAAAFLLFVESAAFSQTDTLFHLVSGSYNDDAMALERANELSNLGYKPRVVTFGEFNRVVFKTVKSKKEAQREIAKVNGSWFYREEVKSGTASNSKPQSNSNISVSVEPADTEKEENLTLTEDDSSEKTKVKGSSFTEKLSSYFSGFKKSPFLLPIIITLIVLILLISLRKVLLGLFKRKKKKIISPYKCNDIILVGRTQINLMQTLLRRNYGFQANFNTGNIVVNEQFTLSQIALQLNPAKNAVKAHIPISKKMKVADFYKKFTEVFGFELNLTHIDTGSKLDPEDNFLTASEKGVEEKQLKKSDEKQA